MIRAMGILSRLTADAPETPRRAPVSARAGWADGVWDGIAQRPAGGLVSDGGFGQAADKSTSARWLLSGLDRYTAEALRRTSWAARRVVETPVNDSFAKWRTFTSDDEASTTEEQMVEAEKLYGVKDALRRAWIAARLHGTACVVMVTAEDDPEQPLEPERIRPGDLKALHVFDQWSMSSPRFNEDWASPDFGMPLVWRITTRFGNTAYIHPSRVLVFYGDRPLTANGRELQTGQWGWWAGSSVLEGVLRAINAEEIASAATAHVLAENAMLILKSAGLSDKELENPKIVAERLQTLNRMRGLSVMLLDEDDEASREGTPASGSGQVLEMLGRRVAWAAGMPETVFLGSPGVGFASSVPEHQAYASFIRGLQESVLDPLLARLDAVVARSHGIAEPPEYEWVPVVSEEEATLAANIDLRTTTADKLRKGKLATLEEARTFLREDEQLEAALEEGVPDDLAEENEPQPPPAPPGMGQPEGFGEPADEGFPAPRGEDGESEDGADDDDPDDEE